MIENTMSNGNESQLKILANESAPNFVGTRLIASPGPNGEGVPGRDQSRPYEFTGKDVDTDLRRQHVVFFGMRGNFSSPPLLALLENNVDVRAVVLPAQVEDATRPAICHLEAPSKARSLLPVLHSSLHTSILQIAWERGIPAWEVQRMSGQETIDVLRGYQPDFICVACFSLYIPRKVLDIPRLGCLNVHPSLLPANRGPDPLFWTFHEGSRQAGVTIHLMDEGLDTGPIVAQEAIDVPDGIRYAELEVQCAELGGKLLVRAVHDLFRGTASLTLQDEQQSSYLPTPTEKDFIVPVAEWDARRVQLLVDNVLVSVADAISYSHETVRFDTGRAIRCKDGWIYVSESLVSYG
jgi:methionyl-tRNA formyltransferase